MSEYIRWQSFTKGELELLQLALSVGDHEGDPTLRERVLREVERELRIRGKAATAHEPHTKSRDWLE